jgi:hypothetical protein
MKNNEKNTKIELTPEQQYPGLLLPEDLKILSPEEASALECRFTTRIKRPWQENTLLSRTRRSRASGPSLEIRRCKRFH